MSTVTVTLGQLVDRALLELQGPAEQGRRVVLAESDNGLTAVDGTTFKLVEGTDGSSVNPTDLIEFGSELLLVTAKTDDPEPLYTAARAYYQTTATTHASGTVGHLNPSHPRRRVAEGVRRSFARLEALGIPFRTVDTFTRQEGYAYLEMPANTREVLQVLYWGTDGRLRVLDGWRFFDTVPTGKFASGKALNVGYYVADEDELEIVYTTPYRWSSYPDEPDEDSTVEMREGSEDLPALYASAWSLSAREISRSELDRSEEWNRSEPQERGQSGALVRARWQEFYRALDEARRLDPPPQPLVYVPRPKF
jgi:hypothetical protein